ncbi:MAG TPA: hypothetical protein VF834_02085 [Streptosporangiaceae bacterium]
MGRESSRDKDGDQAAAWRDLVARLELPSPVDSAAAPWPDRENLHSTAESGRAGQPGGTSSPPGSTSSQPGGTSGQPESRPRGETPASRGRVIRPATFLHSADPIDDSPRAGGPGAVPPERTAASDDCLDPPTAPDLAFPDFDDLADEDDADDRYVPPPVPPLPKLDPVAKGAWTALFGGPGYLLLATILSWQIPGWAELTAVAAFVAGFVVLISRLGDGPSRRDGPDQGAVV